MSELGYKSYYQVLNAKNYGIPQNRERVFTISIRNDIDINYKFPEPKKLELKLKDLLEKEVDEKYFLSQKMTNYVLDLNDSQAGTEWEGRANNDSLNLNVAHALSVRGAGGCQRAGVSNFVCEGIDKEIKVSELKEYKNYFSWPNSKGNINSQDNRAFKDETISGTIPTGRGIPNVLLGSAQISLDQSKPEECLRVRNATKQGYLEATEGDGVDISSRMEYHRGNVQKETSQTITCQGGNNVGVVVRDKGQEVVKETDIANTLLARDYKGPGNFETTAVSVKGEEMGELRIRKLTPRECWRLMGFSDEAFNKAKEVNSDSQLYKQAGNSIVVDVLEAILGNLLED